MSLKAFHIFFIMVCVLLALGFGAWEVKGYFISGEAVRLVAGLLSFLAAAGLIVYGKRFMKKLKKVSMI